MAASRRIGHVLVEYAGGIGTALSTLLPAQVEAGESVTLLISLIGDADLEHLLAAGVAVEPLGRIGLLPHRLRDYDIVHVHSADVRNLVAACLSHRPVVFTLHGLRAVTRPLSTVRRGRLPSVRGVSRRIRRAALSLCLRHGVAQVVAVSAFLAARAQALYRLPPSRVTVVRNGLASHQIQRHAAAVRKQGHVIGWVGRLVAVKRVDILLRAAAELLGEGECPSLGVVVVGDGGLRPPLEAMARQLGLKDVVRFVGYSRDVSAYLLGMDIFVLPSQSEGCSNVVLEALAAGVPVVVLSDGGGAVEMVSRSGGGVVVDSEADLATTLSTLLRDAKARGELARRGVAYARRELPPDVWAARYAEVYNRAQAGRKWVVNSVHDTADSTAS